MSQDGAILATASVSIELSDSCARGAEMPFRDLFLAGSQVCGPPFLLKLFLFPRAHPLHTHCWLPPVPFLQGQAGFLPLQSINTELIWS